MTKKQKKLLKKIGLAGAVFLLAVLFSFLTPDFNGKSYLSLFLFRAAYVIIGGSVLKKAAWNIRHGQVFDENFLMCIATIGAFFVGEYPEGVAVMLFYQVGELFESYAVGKSRKSIASLMQIRPDFANLITDTGITEVSPETVRIGDFILVKPGEKIPLDGIITEGFSSIDTAALTGEALPFEAAPGDSAVSGCINLSGTLHIRVTKEFGDSTVKKILDMVENASSKKAKAENFISKFARYYTPVVVILALILAILPPLVLSEPFGKWIYRALNFLVVSCPCALVISIPLGFFGGIGGAAKQGILMKGSNYLEALATADTFVFDKTGTLTKGNFKVTKIEPAGYTEDELLTFAALAESHSSHPIAVSIRNAYAEKCLSSCETPVMVTDVTELAGFGIRAVINGHTVFVGREKLLTEQGIACPAGGTAGTSVFLAVDGVYAGSIFVEDEIKPDTSAAIKSLRKLGIKKQVLLTGDKKETGESLAARLHLDAAFTDLLPADKVTHLETLLSDQTAGHPLAYVGDGINDAPVLARADIGIAMGGLGSDAAIEAADIVIMTDEPSKLALAIRIARFTRNIVRQNVVFAIGIKVLVLILSALGITGMWMAVFADVGVCVLAILNSMRALR